MLDKRLEEALNAYNKAVERVMEERRIKSETAITDAVDKYKKENDDWRKRYNQLELLLGRLTLDEKTRKAWLVAGDYQMLQFYLNEIRKKTAGLANEKNSGS